MEFITETVSKKQAILIVSQKTNALLPILKAELKRYEAEIFFSSKIPKTFHAYDYCFFINEPVFPIPVKHNQRLIFIFIKHQKQAAEQLKKIGENTRIISFTGDAINKEQVDKILWFIFSQSKEKFLTLEAFNLKKISQSFKKKKINWKYFLKKRFLLYGLFLIIVIHLFFIPFLTLASFSCYQSFQALRSEDIAKASSRLISGRQQLAAANSFYQIVRPTYLLFSIAMFPDIFFDLNRQGFELIDTTIRLRQDGQEIFRLILKRDKSNAEKSQIDQIFNRLENNLDKISGNLEVLNQKLPQFPPLTTQLKNKTNTALDYLLKIKQYLPYLPDLLAKNAEKKYLLLFANNRELRPGGGFIGSYGIVKFKDYTLEDFQVYDVYDADGQLNAHIEPPRAIRDYLHQPHWFLRDSAFSPDFLENYAQAKFFLEKEMQQTDFSGAALLTTNTIENILEAFGEIYLPDFQEKVNSKNFYLKAQTYAEKNFFPGSIQKKSFLGSLSRQILLKIEDVSLKNLALQTKKSLDEKQLVIFSDNQSLQEVLDASYWSGRLIKPQCVTASENCIVDFLFPIDANLGVNKANYYIYRSINLKTNINQEGVISHVLDVQFKNESQSDVFPGGHYDNYFQIYLPQDTQIKQITKNDVLIEQFDEKNLDYKIVGFLFQVPPQQTVNIRLEYTLSQTFKKGKGLYQLIVQKQIGSNNNDLGINFNLAKNFYILNQNFSPLVKDNQIVYNTNLVADKIFINELIKE